MMYPRHVGRPVAHDLHADGARPDVELLDPDGHADDARMAEHRCRMAADAISFFTVRGVGYVFVAGGPRDARGPA